MVYVTDVRNCAIDNGLCEQRCDMVNGSVVCSCWPGFILWLDDRGCHGNVYLVLFIQVTEVRNLSLFTTSIFFNFFIILISRWVIVT